MLRWCSLFPLLDALRFFVSGTQIRGPAILYNPRMTFDRASALRSSLGVKFHSLRGQNATLPPSNGTQNAGRLVSELETPHETHRITYLPILLVLQTAPWGPESHGDSMVIQTCDGAGRGYSHRSCIMLTLVHPAQYRVGTSLECENRRKQTAEWTRRALLSFKFSCDALVVDRMSRGCRFPACMKYHSSFTLPPSGRTSSLPLSKLCFPTASIGTISCPAPGPFCDSAARRSAQGLLALTTDLDLRRRAVIESRENLPNV